MSTLDQCPNGHDLRQELADGRQGWRTIGVEVRGIYDGTLYWLCPDCGIAWPRFADGPRAATSKRLADEHNAKRLASLSGWER